MTGRTHDLAAFTALNIVFVTAALPRMSIATAFVALGANMIGGLFPDIDNATSDIWDKFRGGTVAGRIIKPLIGGHRMLSHSLCGLALTGFVLKKILPAVGTVLIADMEIVWWSVMVGYASHLITDSLTTQGVPWLFPLPVRIGFPPIRQLRIRTGGFVEKIVVFPGLLILNGYLLYIRYPLYLGFVKALGGQ
ncbi:hypothetical protein A2Z33_05380 [Candidatus Gottesmanbacteria bacterium RBG_16_52_11]|uniref:Metal-dependent hydrolase n=1 Tax=Candidatus Gottesmanbacteria bacterium RBG_16_52_11 TaxID=1798374 RepID=A0A1F5YMX2_9BACT|nr:MAG: hypothetical protein A2Z33_05380 [Candidatus Gottesmanbacteria bacterium RBG_16_52_11]